MPATTAPTVLITGASRGLGRHTAALLTSGGWRVLLGCRDRARGEAVAAELREARRLREPGPGDLGDGRVDVIPLDVSDPGSITAAVMATGAITDGRLTTLVNNAAVFFDDEDEEIELLTPAVCQRLFLVNSVGPLLMTQAFLPLLRASGAASVVTVSSDDAEPGTEDGTYTCYRMSKAAVNMMTTNLAVSLKPDAIAVNGVYPGWIPTDMGGPEAPDDIATAARLVAWVAGLPVSVPGAVPTGQTFSVHSPPWAVAPAGGTLEPSAGPEGVLK